MPHLAPEQWLDATEAARRLSVGRTTFLHYADTYKTLLDAERTLPTRGEGKRRHRRWTAHGVAVLQQQIAAERVVSA